MRLIFLVVCLAGWSGVVQAQQIVPLPVSMQRNAGEFSLTAGTRIISNPGTQEAAQMLRDYLRPATGFLLPVLAEGRPGGAANAVHLTLDKKLAALGKEGYRIHSDARGVTITAFEPAGLLYGVQTLRQLLPSDIYRAAPVQRTWQLPAVTIEDQPRFGWRGSHLDTARHFMPKSFVLKHIELLAQHKMNIFHWHLTDDQGWRIEIKRFPRLTQVGAWRSETQLTPQPGDAPGLRYDGQPHGGFYTQDDIREVVAYAAARNITVVPEIEMPGHALAAIAAYPELGNHPEQQLAVGREWGIIKQVFSPEDSTVHFLQQVLDEVLTLFPSPYIHVGGDECPKVEWANSPAVLARLKTLKLVPPSTTLADIANYRNAQGKPAEHPALHRLQSWFIGQMDTYLTSHGRRLIGWDEILDGGLAPAATVMSWRGEEGGLQAAGAGHDVVMTPERFTYLDYAQAPLGVPGSREPLGARAVNTLEHVYAYEPVPAAMPEQQRGHVLGSQAQLWTEYMRGPREVEYMAWPRLLAMSELLWSPKSKRDYGAFQQRLPASLQRLDAQDVNYRSTDGKPGTN